MKQWLSTAAVAAACFSAFFVSAQIIKRELPVTGDAVHGWQTYCPLDHTLVHKAKTFAATSVETIDRVSVDGVHSHDMFTYSQSGELHLLDRQTGNQWLMQGGVFRPVEVPRRCPSFSYKGTTFSLEEHKEVKACRGECASIAIRPGSYVFAYAAYEDGVVALSNYGDAVLYRDGNWCRMTRLDGDIYQCPEDGAVEPTVTEPREVQFYTSIKYKGQTLVGEWPTGRLYEFDGRRLAPIKNQPPFATAEPQGYEAQAMADYCGDLYVGYWPTGEIWKMARESGKWSLAVSLFPPSDEFYPFSDRPRDERNSRFYGRRVASLVLHEGSMYATTANLNDWPHDYVSPVMSKEDADLYGATWRITRRGCKTRSRR